MATYEYGQFRAPSAGERLGTLAAAAFSNAFEFFRAVRNRRSVAKLLDWDERMLRDIGLTQGDVRSVMSMPMAEDPSHRLVDLSVERRTALRADASERQWRDRRFRDAERGTLRRSRVYDLGI